MTIQGVTVVTADPCLTEADIRVVVERAVRTRVSTVTVDRDGRVALSDPLEAALGRVHGDVVAAYTLGGEEWEYTSPDEVDWAVGVLYTAWTRARAGGRP